MPHDINLITTIAAALGFGLVFGFIATRMTLPALVGYLAAGILIGPATPGFVADTALAGQLAEIGVMLMMFGVGLHFSLDALWEVRRIALPGAILQIAVATAMGMGLAHWWGWSVGGGLVFGLALSPRRSASPTARPGCSACPSRWAPFLPAWCCANPN